MAFFKFRWLGEREQGEASGLRSRVPPTESIELMRRRARHRLIGAAVLVLAGVLGFPLLFDTQPRPIPVEIPIEIPDRAKVAPLVVPTAPAADAPAAFKPLPSPLPVPPAVTLGKSVPTESSVAGLVDGEELVKSKRSAGQGFHKSDVKPESKPTPAPVKPDAKPEGKVNPKTESKAASPLTVVELKHDAHPAGAVKTESRPSPKHEPKDSKVEEPKLLERKSSPDEAARAKALLEGSALSSAKLSERTEHQDGDKNVVQVGAFADADKAREVRSKLERAGLKTYTQVVDTKDGKRTRVRVGPFSSRAEADKAAARVRALDLSASVVSQ